MDVRMATELQAGLEHLEIYALGVRRSGHAHGLVLVQGLFQRGT